MESNRWVCVNCGATGEAPDEPFSLHECYPGQHAWVKAWFKANPGAKYTAFAEAFDRETAAQLRRRK